MAHLKLFNDLAQSVNLLGDFIDDFLIWPAGYHLCLVGAENHGHRFAYKNAIVQPPDATPPSMPQNLLVRLTSPTSIALTWSPSDDNVGTAAYVVYRGQTLMTKTTLTGFADSGLAEAATYVYSVFAIDASFNRSPIASVFITMPDMTPLGDVNND